MLNSYEIVRWKEARLTGDLPRVSRDFPALLDEFETRASSKREVSRAAVSASLELALTPTVGCFQPGYLLIIPNREAYSFAELSSAELESALAPIELWREALECLMGEVVVAEHGSGASTVCSAACVAQAHLHLIPLPGLREELRERYYHDGGRPNETLTALSDLPPAAEDRPYVLLSARAGLNEVWFDVQKFPRQYVRRQAAALLGLADVYNWRTHPFIEQMELTKTLLAPVFQKILPGGAGLKLKWESPYEFPELIEEALNPHIGIYGVHEAERLLFFASCRARGVAEEALDQIGRLHEAGKVTKEHGARARAAAHSSIKNPFDTCTMHAAIRLLRMLGESQEKLEAFERALLEFAKRE